MSKLMNHPIIRMENMADRLWESGEKKQAIRIYKLVDFDVWKSKSLIGIFLPKFLAFKYWEKYIMDEKLYEYKEKEYRK